MPKQIILQIRIYDQVTNNVLMNSLILSPVSNSKPIKNSLIKMYKEVEKIRVKIKLLLRNKMTFFFPAKNDFVKTCFIKIL